MSAHTPKQVEHDSIVAPDQQKLKAAALLTLATITGILAGYHETTGSMISIWMRSETFAHGFLIFPFSAYLIWGQRKHLSEALCQPSPFALLVLASLGFSWLLATLASVQVFKQFLLIAMIPAAVWAILGYTSVPGGQFFFHTKRKLVRGGGLQRHTVPDRIVYIRYPLRVSHIS